MSHKYYHNIEENLRNNKNNLDYILNNLITSFSLYFLSDHFIGNELERFNVPVNPKSNNILKNDNIDAMKEMQILFVQNDFFDIFINKYLPNIKCKFILITGQWNLPQLKVEEKTEKLLKEERIHTWFSQNPIFKHPKYFPFPYGLNYGYMKKSKTPDILTYVNELLKTCNKKTNIENLPMNYKTNKCRLIFPRLKPIKNSDFYEKMHQSKFILSPIGDRNETYRHWEAIGLGTIPIANVGELYKDLFQYNMYYVKNTQKMLQMYKSQPKLNYNCPNKDLICLDYWKDYIKEKSNITV